jgi:hypothetical protein
MLGHAETKIHQAFAAGEPGGPGQTALGELDAMCARMMQGLSEAARNEINAYITRLRSEHSTPGAPAPATAPVTEASK